MAVNPFENYGGGGGYLGGMGMSPFQRFGSPGNTPAGTPYQAPPGYGGDGSVRGGGRGPSGDAGDGSVRGGGRGPAGDESSAPPMNRVQPNRGAMTGIGGQGPYTFTNQGNINPIWQQLVGPNSPLTPYMNMRDNPGLFQPGGGTGQMPEWWPRTGFMGIPQYLPQGGPWGMQNTGGMFPPGMTQTTADPRFAPGGSAGGGGFVPPWQRGGQRTYGFPSQQNPWWMPGGGQGGWGMMQQQGPQQGRDYWLPGMNPYKQQGQGMPATGTAPPTTGQGLVRGGGRSQYGG